MSGPISVGGVQGRAVSMVGVDRWAVAKVLESRSLLLP